MNSADFHDYHHRLLYTKSGNYSSTFTYMDWYASCLLTLTLLRSSCLALFAPRCGCVSFVVTPELSRIAGKKLEIFREVFYEVLCYWAIYWGLCCCSGYLALTRATGSWRLWRRTTTTTSMWRKKCLRRTETVLSSWYLFVPVTLWICGREVVEALVTLWNPFLLHVPGRLLRPWVIVYEGQILWWEIWGPIDCGVTKAIVE